MCHDDDKDGRVQNEDTYVSHDQMVAQAQDVDAPQSPPQVVDRRNCNTLKIGFSNLVIKLSIYLIFVHLM